MNLVQLIRDLEDKLDEHGDVEVRLMTQPNWPFECMISGVVSSSDFTDEDAQREEDDLRCVILDESATDEERVKAQEDLDEIEHEREVAERVIYITEGEQIGYGNKQAWER